MENEKKENKTSAAVVPQQQIENLIFTIRGVQVMLDRDLAKLYDVTTGNLNKAVKRNLFPSSLGIHAYVRTNTMGATIDDIAFYHWGLIIQAGFYTILSLVFYYWQLKKRMIEE